MMSFRLARMCGTVDRQAVLDSLTPEEFLDWCAYWTREPFGMEWDQTGTLAATFQNEIDKLFVRIFGGARNPNEPNHYIPFRPSTKSLTGKAMAGVFRSMAR